MATNIIDYWWILLIVIVFFAFIIIMKKRKKKNSVNSLCKHDFKLGGVLMFYEKYPRIIYYCNKCGYAVHKPVVKFSKELNTDGLRK